MLQMFAPCSPIFVITAWRSFLGVVRSLFALVRLFCVTFSGTRDCLGFCYSSYCMKQRKIPSSSTHSRTATKHLTQDTTTTLTANLTAIANCYSLLHPQTRILLQQKPQNPLSRSKTPRTHAQQETCILGIFFPQSQTGTRGLGAQQVPPAQGTIKYLFQSQTGTRGLGASGMEMPHAAPSSCFKRHDAPPQRGA